MGVSQNKFALMRGASKQSATHWKKRGLLVFEVDGTVNVEASNALLDGRPSNYRGGRTGVKPKRAARGERKAAAAIVKAPSPKDDDDIETEAAALLDSGAVAMLSHADAVRKKENYLALLRQLEYDRESGAVVDVDEVARQVAGEYAIVRSQLSSLPAKLAPRMAMLRTPQEFRDFLERAISEALEALTLDADGITPPVSGGGKGARGKAAQGKGSGAQAAA